MIPLAGWYGYVYQPGDIAQWAGFMRLGGVAPLSGPLRGFLELIAEILPAAILVLLGAAFRAVGAVPSRLHGACMSDPRQERVTVNGASIIKVSIDGSWAVSGQARWWSSSYASL